jgi:hypothetical protein
MADRDEEDMKSPAERVVAVNALRCQLPSSTVGRMRARVRNLRTKIEADPGRPVRLFAVFGVGYKPSAPRPSGEGGAGRVP